MKRFLSIITALVLSAIFFTGCSAPESDGKLKIVTTIFPQYDLASHITGDKADITMLLTPGAESHTYEPTPSDIARIQQADLFIYNGGESEVWVNEILSSVGKDDMRAIRLMDYVDLYEEDGEDEHGYDEHIFTSLRNADAILKKINEEICALDPENRDFYTKNSDSYSEEILALDEKFSDMIDSAKRKTVVFGDRFPFKYFAEDYGLDCYAAFSGCSSETEASTAVISQLISIVKDNDIPIVFYIEFSSQKTADKIAQASGVKTGLLHSCHNISKEDMKSGVSYTDIMSANFDILSEALN